MLGRAASGRRSSSGRQQARSGDAAVVGIRRWQLEVALSCSVLYQAKAADGRGRAAADGRRLQSESRLLAGY